MIGPLTMLLLAAAPTGAPPPEHRPLEAAARPAETAVSVGMGQVRRGGALGLGLSLARGIAPEAPASGKSRLVYRLEVHTGESGFPRWIEARLSLTEGARPANRCRGRSPGPAEATVRRCSGLRPPLAPAARSAGVHLRRDHRGAVARSSGPMPALPAVLSLGFGVEF